MLILSLRTDKPEAEIGLYNNDTQVLYHSWQAHRQLAETIHQKLQTLLEEKDYQLNDLEGLIVFKGPGSFTGLRIGLTVANALADALQLPIVGTSGDEWITEGLGRIKSGESEHIVLPKYGAAPHITIQKK